MTALISHSISSTQVNVLLAITAVLSILLFQYANISIVRDLSIQLSDLWEYITESRFAHGFIASFSVIIFSELGDKTFFISAIMAMKNPRLTVFLATMTANFVNNALSIFMGMLATVIPKSITTYASIFLFGFFGFKMIYESRMMSNADSQEGLEEAEEELKKLETADKKDTPNRLRQKLIPFFSLIFIETFSLIFFAEWGDRSQISTVVLAAREDVFGVSAGAMLGYCVCAVIAVLGGRLMAQMISIKTVTLFGGVLFILFSIIAFIMRND